jgi:hypothetical protein
MTADDDKPLPPLGTGGRDRAGIIAVFEGDPMPPPSGPGYSQVVVISRGTPKPTGGSDATGMPAMAFDAMPPELTRFPAGKVFDRLTLFYGRYSRGELPRLINGEFEELMGSLDNRLESLESKALAGRNGGRPSQQAKLLNEIPKLLEKRISNHQAAGKLNVSPSTYERAKRKFLQSFRKGFDGKGNSKPL